MYFQLSYFFCHFQILASSRGLSRGRLGGCSMLLPEEEDCSGRRHRLYRGMIK